MPINSSILALDVGDVRVGAALANSHSMLAQPLITLTNDAQFIDQIKEIIDQNKVELVVVGLPRNLDGNDTAQTQKVREFTDLLRTKIFVKIEYQDEALSSVRAHEAVLAGDKHTDIDALAASYILDDYLTENNLTTK